MVQYSSSILFLLKQRFLIHIIIKIIWIPLQYLKVQMCILIRCKTAKYNYNLKDVVI
jgi:hypothetical protein